VKKQPSDWRKLLATIHLTEDYYPNTQRPQKLNRNNWMTKEENELDRSLEMKKYKWTINI
jgi:hypothetical protein